MLDSFVKLDPRVQVKNPVMFVVWIGSILTSVLFVQAALGRGELPGRLHPGDLALVVVHSPLRKLRRGDSGRAGTRAGRVASTGTSGPGRPPARRAAPGRGAHRRSPRPPSQERCDLRRERGVHPGRRGGDRGDRLDRRECDHGRERPGDPGERRGSQRRDRGHAGPLRLAGHPGHRQSGRNVSRPNDLHGRGGEAEEDAERDRPVDPARGDDDHLPRSQRRPSSR